MINLFFKAIQKFLNLLKNYFNVKMSQPEDDEK